MFSNKDNWKTSLAGGFLGMWRLKYSSPESVPDNFKQKENKLFLIFRFWFVWSLNFWNCMMKISTIDIQLMFLWSDIVIYDLRDYNNLNI